VKDEYISAEDFSEWLNHPVTKAVKNVIGRFRNELAESLINGGTLKGDGGSTVEETAKTIGILYGADLFLEAKFMEDQDEN
jgi:hypothetical protein